MLQLCAETFRNAHEYEPTWIPYIIFLKRYVFVDTSVIIKFKFAGYAIFQVFSKVKKWQVEENTSPLCSFLTEAEVLCYFKSFNFF